MYLKYGNKQQIWQNKRNLTIRGIQITNRTNFLSFYEHYRQLN